MRSLFPVSISVTTAPDLTECQLAARNVLQSCADGELQAGFICAALSMISGVCDRVRGGRKGVESVHSTVFHSEFRYVKLCGIPVISPGQNGCSVSGITFIITQKFFCLGYYMLQNRSSNNSPRSTVLLT